MPLRHFFPDLVDPSPLLGRRVLVAEDEYLLAEDLCEELERLGAEMIGPVVTVADALMLLNDGGAPDLAILAGERGAGRTIAPLPHAPQPAPRPAP